MNIVIRLAAWAFIAAFFTVMAITESCRTKQTLELQMRATQALEAMAAKQCH